MIKVEYNGTKINFIDENDVFLGYDLSQNCCEHAGYVILSEIEHYSYEGFDKSIEVDLEEYFFDEDWFEEAENESEDLDAGGQVFFKLISNKGNPDIYLSIFNAHNGYYSHGFKTNVKGVDFYYL